MAETATTSPLAAAACNCTGKCAELGYCPTAGKYMPTPTPLPGHSIVGTCSICRGPVTTPTMWSATIPAPKSCSSCGATAKPDYGPVIPMERKT